jgi:hypothetical protein
MLAVFVLHTAIEIHDWKLTLKPRDFNFCYAQLFRSYFASNPIRQPARGLSSGSGAKARDSCFICNIGIIDCIIGPSLFFFFVAADQYGCAYMPE